MGYADTFLSRYVRDHTKHTWAQIKAAPVEEDGDSHLATQKLCCLQQKAGKSVQNFIERILTLASEEYRDLDQPLVQTVFIDVLIDGVKDDVMAKRL